ncbi:energy transducer TonB [Sphingomonas sanxanigenens]|uniref:TonB C-terminal domain-containing protein n=1 Tax=Sphingomonas sanxanigenens DSM 19645 = NX02 TaxID=1123269 RepID=W0AA58_9SPHN|nr:energy transducer TonB [Sphingomonas sanxanigenens]AHE53372.1 hypothetical protein NX02_08240 [Sphingomonas sanxanigenens DSM 19645 = NX02]
MQPASRTVAAALSLAMTAATFAGLITIGLASTVRKPHRERALTVLDLAALKGSETADADAPAEAMPQPPVEATPPVEPPPPPPPPVPTQAPLPIVPMPARAVPVVVALPPPVAAAPSPARAQAPAAPAAPAPAVRRRDAAASQREGVRDGMDVDAPPGNSRAYAARVRSWLLAHQVYPRYARMRRLEGSVGVRFVLDRSGRLIEGALTGTSGQATLDTEGAAMLRRASPYPAAPAEVPGERITFNVAIDFRLRD